MATEEVEFERAGLDVRGPGNGDWMDGPGTDGGLDIGCACVETGVGTGVEWVEDDVEGTIVGCGMVVAVWL